MLFKRIALIVICFSFFLNAFSQEVSFKYQVDKMALFKGDQRLTPFVYTELCQFSEGLTWACKGELYGYIDTAGTERIPFIYHDVSSFKNGVAFVSLDSGDHFGLINKAGDSLCNFIYTEALDFKDGLAPVKLNGKWGLINTNGDSVLSTIFDHPPVYISKDFIIVSINNEVGVMNQHHKIVHPFNYQYINTNGEAYLNNKKYWLNLN